MLWNNPNPDNAFASQNITLLSSDYDVLEIYYKNSNAGNYMFCQKMLKGFSTQLTWATYSSDVQYALNFSRDITRSSDTTYGIANAHQGRNTVNNIYLIPVKIYGYKYS